MTGSQPTYPLEVIKRLVSEKHWVITRSASDGARRLGLGATDIEECIGQLQATSFYKTMPSEKRPGTHQDVYRIEYAGHRIYLKLQVGTDGRAVTISFKEDESHDE